MHLVERASQKKRIGKEARREPVVRGLIGFGGLDLESSWAPKIASYKAYIYIYS